MLCLHSICYIYELEMLINTSYVNEKKRKERKNNICVILMINIQIMHLHRRASILCF